MAEHETEELTGGKPTIRMCSKCNQFIKPGVAYMNLPGDLLCHESCFDIGTCGGCKQPIKVSDGMLEALDSKWHPACFKCGECSCELKGRYGVVDNKPYCTDCAGKKTQVEQQKKKQEATSKLGNCPGCDKPITGGKCLQMTDAVWHADCFVCFKCRKPFSGGVFQIEGKLHCKDCKEEVRAAVIAQQQAEHEKQQAEKRAQQAAQQAQQVPQGDRPMCATCNKLAEGRVVQVLGKHYHRDCFVCFKCKQPIQGGQMASINDQPHCVPCSTVAKYEHEEKVRKAKEEHEKYVAAEQQKVAEERKRAAAEGKMLEGMVKCSVCAKVLEGQYQELDGKQYCADCAEVVQRGMSCAQCRKRIDPGVPFRRAIGKLFHNPCFKCVVCKVVLESNYQDKNDKIYCEDHYVEKFGAFTKKCPRCLKAITTGDVVQNNGKAYHAHCFTCHKCNQPFPDGQFMPAASGNLYCKGCFFTLSAADR